MNDEQSGNPAPADAPEAPRPPHIPVLLPEVLEYLNVHPGGNYLDATAGAGGHAQAILERSSPGKLLALDCDPRALEVTRARLAGYGERLMTQQGNFARIAELHAASGLGPVDGVLADLGVNSMQLADPARGLSFAQEGFLDMRLDPGSPTTAADLVNNLSERELADIFLSLGEERHARRVARAIVRARPISVTTKLALVVTRAIPSRPGPLHPATRCFMALRIAANRELENLEQFLASVLAVVRPGGRVVMVAFHSLEDRQIKLAFRRWQGEGRATVLTRKVVRPAEEEIRRNPRARSARLRAAERTGIGVRD